MDTLRSIWSIEFATIIRDATTTLHDFDVNMFFASTLIYGNIFFWLVWIVRFIVGLLKDATKNKDTTENTNGPIVATKDTTESKDATENTKDPIENEDATEIEDPINNTEADDLPSGAVSIASSPPPLVPEPTGPRTAIKQLRNIRSLLKEVESKVKELESSIAEENSTTEDSTTDESASNEEQHQNYERIERDLSKAQKAQDKANARKWSDRQRRRWTSKYIRTQNKRWRRVV